MEQVYKTKRVVDYEKEEPIFNEGIVACLGVPNIRYRTKNKGSRNFRTDEGCPIKVGDRVWLSDPQLSWFLEDWAFAVFNDRKMYKVAKRYMIGGILHGN